jgi:hypothetical protein
MQDNLSPSRDSKCELPSCKSTAPQRNFDLVASIRCRRAVSYKGITRGTIISEYADACTSIWLNCSANNEWSIESSTEQLLYCFRINFIVDGSSLQEIEHVLYGIQVPAISNELLSWTNQLLPENRIFLEKLGIPKLVKNFTHNSPPIFLILSIMKKWREKITINFTLRVQMGICSNIAR